MENNLVYSQTSPMVLVMERLVVLSNVRSSITILGESGTGKEDVAKLLHSLSSFKDEPFLSVNCANFSEYLLESELFGYKKGSFTSADHDYDGLAKRCGNGTLFLDEFDSLTLTLQAKFLRLLENKTFLPIGFEKPLTFNGRVIVASNKSLADKVLDKTLRDDLFYRLNVFTIEIPPLRERDGDVEFLSYYFLAMFNNQYKQNRVLNNSDVLKLKEYDWLGNVRELKNCMENFVVFGNFNDFFSKITNNRSSKNFKNRYNKTLYQASLDFKKDYIFEVLKQCGGNQTKAAKILDVNRTYLVRLLTKFNKKD